MSFLEDTIVAPITPPGRGGVSIVRLSGPGTVEILSCLAERAQNAISNPRHLVYTTIFDYSPQQLGVESSQGGAPNALDQGLVVFFRAGASFTGEDAAELHLHGSPYLVDRLIESAVQLGGRIAEPGEFSKRAYLNGQLDLSQAEAVADLVNAETAAQARAAREQLSGKLSRAIERVGEPLRDLVAEVEAFIDFPEEEIELQSLARWREIISSVEGQLGEYLASFRGGRLEREGAEVAIVGLPNAGKSSLLNRLVGMERAIVSPLAGTTRDTIEERISLSGVCVRLWDTAGIVVSGRAENRTENRTVDSIEELGIERSWQRIAAADLVLFVFDGAVPIAEQQTLYFEVKARAAESLVLCNKSDQESERSLREAELTQLGIEALYLSALTGAGLAEFRTRLRVKILGDSVAEKRASVVITTRRHFDALLRANVALAAGKAGLAEEALPPELVAAHLREALTELDDIVGVTHTEDILGRIFSRFCIGK